jgi:hypothetical protein
VADDLTAGGRPVYRDSAGTLREVPVAAGLQAGGTATSASAPAITSTFSMAAAVDGANPTLIVASPVALVSVDGYNARTGGVSIQFYDKASPPVVGTDTPKWTVYLPALTPANRVYPTGIRFAVGLAIALVPDDAGGLMAGDIQGLNLGYAA